MGGGAPRSSCLGGEGYFLSGAQPTHRFVSSASDSEAYRSSTTLTLPQNSTSETTVTIMVPFGPEPRRLRRMAHSFFS
jgi:hypothetical protein